VERKLSSSGGGVFSSVCVCVCVRKLAGVDVDGMGSKGNGRTTRSYSGENFGLSMVKALRESCEVWFWVVLAWYRTMHSLKKFGTPPRTERPWVGDGATERV